MKKLYLIASAFLCCTTLVQAQQSTKQIVDKTYIEKVLGTLASDEMEGRNSLNASAGKAADFIAQQFSDIGLQPYAESNYRQSFKMSKISRKSSAIKIQNKALDDKNYLIVSNEPTLEWTEISDITIKTISKEDDFATKYREFARSNEDLVIFVDPKFSSFIERFNRIYSRDNIVNSSQSKGTSKVFIVGDAATSKYSIKAENNVTDIDLFNVAAIIPGKSKPNEYVVFSAHYDHIGIIKADGQDSIANGADDDASGTTAMISLAKYYKELNNNERSLIFVAFTAEEIGMYGSKYFSNNINPDEVVAMINIEMIGKDSKFGPNSLYVTGYERSNLAKLMQENVVGTSFQFMPDPYPQQNLFYRSDNAVLAALGVPAHTFSTSQIDKDKHYHTVKDEITTLDIENIKSSIEAIAKGAEGIVKGTQTPSRVEKLKD